MSEEVKIYLIDQSGSMDLPFRKTTRMEYAKEVLKQEIEKLTKDSETNKVKNLGVYSFGTAFCNCIDVIHHFNEEIFKEELFEKIAKLEPEGGTPIYNAISILTKNLQTLQGKFHLTILTDGIDTCLNSQNEEVINNFLNIQNENLKISTKIIGVDLEDYVLKEYLELSKQLKANFINEEPLSLEEYLNEINNLPRNCKYNPMPSQILSTCSEKYVTYNLNSIENQKVYYTELINSTNINDRRRSYSYYQKNCHLNFPFQELLRKKLSSKLIPDLEKMEIQKVLNYCKLENSNKLIDYTQTGLYWNPNYPNGGADLIFHFHNQNDSLTTVEYYILSNVGEVYTPSASNRFVYEVAANSTLDKRIPVTLVGTSDLDFTILEKVNGSSKEYKFHEKINVKEKGFAPKFFPIGKPYPIYFFSELDDLNLEAFVFPKTQKKPISNGKMQKLTKKDNLYIYYIELDLNGFFGEIEVEIQKNNF